jgi:hypothetical protein
VDTAASVAPVATGAVGADWVAVDTVCVAVSCGTVPDGVPVHAANRTIASRLIAALSGMRIVSLLPKKGCRSVPNISNAILGTRRASVVKMGVQHTLGNENFLTLQFRANSEHIDSTKANTYIILIP